MTNSIRVKRELHLAATEPVAIYASAAYASATRPILLETIRHEALHFQPNGQRQYYERRTYRRRSEDNGSTWRDAGVMHESGPTRLAGQHLFPTNTIFDPVRDVLIGIYGSYEMNPDEGQFAAGNRVGRTYRSHYVLSHDAGKTWTPPRQIIDRRPGFDAKRWSPIMMFGETGGVADGQAVHLPDGTLAVGFSAIHPSAPPHDRGERALEGYSSVVYAQARWSADGASLEWLFGDEIHVDFPLASGGCCEAALAHLGGTRLFNTMRAQGDENHKIPSTRFATTSEDGGLTWSSPEPLRYDDGSTVWTPACVHRFIVSSKTEKTYLLTNILPSPAYAQTPRYPLTIAEFDVETCRVRRATVQVIQDKPADAPEDRRYTNFGLYEERGTGDLILTMPEMPRDKNYEDLRPEDFGSDCIRFRVTLPG